MCGIIVYSGANPADETKVRWLFKENMSRGRDSSGVYTIKQDKSSSRSLYKSTAQADNFIKHRGFIDATKGVGSLIGHTRGASVGTVSYNNAHPFEFGVDEDYVVGVHNGFIIPQLIAKHTKDFGFDKEFEVDSQLIFAALSKNHGDYKVLSQIEGAITVAYMMPNKWGNHVFVYRREPREMHIGFAKEGIYMSSEGDPLHLINCNIVYPINTGNMIVLNEGKIVDFEQLPDPIIKSMKLGCTRSFWESGVPNDEYKDLVPELVKPKYDYSKHNNNHHTKYPNWENNFNGESDPLFPSELFKTENEFGILFKDIRAELENMEYDKINYKECTWYDVEDFGKDNGIVVIKLVDSVKHLPLPGYALIDDKSMDTNGLTTLTGVCILKYDKYQCDYDREITIYDPVEQNKPHKLTLKPKAGSVLEVILQLPFHKKKHMKPLVPRVLHCVSSLYKSLGWQQADFLYLLHILQKKHYLMPLSDLYMENYKNNMDRYVGHIRKGRFLGSKFSNEKKKEVYQMLKDAMSVSPSIEPIQISC